MRKKQSQEVSKESKVNEYTLIHNIHKGFNVAGTCGKISGEW